MNELKKYIQDVPDFPITGITFRDIAPLLRDHFVVTVEAMNRLLTQEEWNAIEAVAGIESRGLILGAALAMKHGKGFVPVRKRGKLPPPVVEARYKLEYGSDALEMQYGSGRILLVDDVIATGGTITAAADLCERAGYTVQAIVSLIDLKLISECSWRDFQVRAAIVYETADQ